VVKLSAADRRNALLDAAWSYVAEHGVHALTLAEAAERGGVSKPIAYNHFQSRAGLLCALYHRYYTGHIEELTKALERAATVEEAAKVIAQAYVDCVEQSGPVAAALAGALSGGAEMETMRRDCDDRYVGLCVATLESRAARPIHFASVVAFVGAAASLSNEVQRGRISKKEAVDHLAGLLASAVT
jgi:AcrR family transcriptional regulator